MGRKILDRQELEKGDYTGDPKAVTGIEVIGWAYAH